MPLRGYRCDYCGHTTDELFNDGYPGTVECEDCGRTASYYIGPTVYRVDFRDGYDWGAGAYFGTKRERDTHADKNGLRRIKD